MFGVVFFRDFFFFLISPCYAIPVGASAPPAGPAASGPRYIQCQAVRGPRAGVSSLTVTCTSLQAVAYIVWEQQHKRTQRMETRGG